jgi:uncharacterized protein (TIGR02757 family)
MPDSNFLELINLLNSRYLIYCNHNFIENDPIKIPHLFKNKNDIEISAFLTSSISWGNRTSIIHNSMNLVKFMDFDPYNFIINFSSKELKPFSDFKHRTFNGQDCIFFLFALKNIYKNYQNLEALFYEGYQPNKSVKEAIIHFRKKFFEIPHPIHSEKHISDIRKNSAAKRINMFLRWMVRKDQVDFGIWKSIPPSSLYLPLDIHTGRIARKLNLLTRKQNDWIAVDEVTKNLKALDPIDPIKYDFALFSMDIYE